MITPKLKNSPLVEAVCEFRFDLENPNDATLPGRLYDLVKEDFPIIKSRNIGTVMPIDETNQADLLVSPLTQFYNHKSNLLLQVGYNMFTVNCVKEYPTWEVFKPVILENYKKYLNLVNPKRISRIILRDINKIHISSESLRIEDYFAFYPTFPKNIEDPISSFNIQVETALQGKRDVLAMRNSTVLPDKGKENSLAFVLDLNYMMNKAGELHFDQVEGWLEIAHRELYNAFIASVTEKSLNDFDT